MSLNSFEYLIPFIILLPCMLLLQFCRKKHDNIMVFQKILLLIFSYYLIYCVNILFLVCLVCVTLFTFVMAIIYEKKQLKSLLYFSVIVLVGVLGYFKYTDFFINSFRQFFHVDTVSLNIILPIGISFYIFSAIAYLFDVSRKEYDAEKSLLSFALYMAFFPKLVAGPIVRGCVFFPQEKAYRGITIDAFKTGIQIFVFGLFKKIVLADHLGVFVDDVFHSPTAFNTGTVILAMLSYSLQIYYDFSGYSDMAIGMSKILGFDFMPNFNLPYIAKNVSEFWKRWHISLSSWFQDYLYIPLGGSRKGSARTYCNLMIVMLVSGLWHGAGWTFIAWGVFYGISSCIYKAVGKHLTKLGTVLNVIITQITVTLFWVVFRADSFATAVKVWKGAFFIHTGISQPYSWSIFAIICLIIGTLAAYYHSKKMKLKDKNGFLNITGYYPVLDLSKFWSQVAFFSFCGLTIILGYFGNTAFIYGAF